MDIVLIGAGGHAKAVVEILQASSSRVVGYLDCRDAAWLRAPRLGDDSAALALDPAVGVVLGIGGIDPASLVRRAELLGNARRPWRPAPSVVHPSAVISSSATIEEGCTILAGAIIQPGARIGAGAIINTGAVVEHDSVVGAGSHISPRAVVLADATVGDYCMIGAGAVVLPGTTVKDNILVPAATRHPR